jgi:hypothetical protein
MTLRRIWTRSIVLAGGLVFTACNAQAPASPSPTMRPSPSVADSAEPSAAPVSPSPAPATPTATATHVESVGSMSAGRHGFDSIVLGDGTVLAIGDDVDCLPGPASPGSETVERFDPATDTWSAAASLNKPRKSFATVPWGDGGALVLGGINAVDQPFSSTKRFDPETGRWADGPLMERAIGGPLAERLGDGRIVALDARYVGETTTETRVTSLVAGSGTWRSDESLDLFVSSAVALRDGSLIAVGSTFESPDTLYRLDPRAGDWELIARPIEIASGDDLGRFGPLIALEGGDMLALNVVEPGEQLLASTRVRRWDSRQDRWIDVAPLGQARDGAMTAVLPDGRVLVAGGVIGGVGSVNVRGTSFLKSTEIFDPWTDTWSAGPDLLERRQSGHARVLADGSVLIFGGDADTNDTGDVPWCPAPLTSTERIYLAG